VVEHDPIPRRSRRRSIAFVAAIVAFDLAVAAGVGYYLSATAPVGGVELSAGVEYGLRARVAASYPGYTVVGVQKITRDDTRTVSGGREVGVYFELQSASHPGFVLSRLYTAAEKQAGDAKNYSNSDDFFNAEATQDQPIESFIGMWVHERPGQTVYFIAESGLSTDPTRTYLVLAQWRERNGIEVKTVQGEYEYAYSAAADTWTGRPAPEPEPVPFTSEAPYVPPSLADTATAVAEGLPGFEPIGTTGDASNEVMLLVKHRKYPGLRMAIYPIWLDPADTTDDMVALFSGDRTKADAFAKAWSDLHGGAIIDLLMLDPNQTDDRNLVYVTYVESIAGVGDTNAESSAQLRYDAKRHKWAVYEPTGWND
jgi:hypothetical protein